MKKVFALSIVAGALALASCKKAETASTEAAGDVVATVDSAANAVVDSAAAVVDSAAAVVDSAAAIVK
ncbi:MAG: hypothetical protein EAZ27_03440 [Cytophagales bacterium]|nr:MAG: hypothetical protein EAZ27_03440 [Cytophagales bacterium]